MGVALRQTPYIAQEPCTHRSPVGQSQFVVQTTEVGGRQ